MRSAKSNQKTIYYATYRESTPIYETDDEGNIVYIEIDGQQVPVEIGTSEAGYSNPIKLKACVSAGKGDSDKQPFGIDVQYSKVISTTNMNLPIDVGTRIWVDIAPNLNENGSTDTKHDYEVKSLAKGLHNVLIAIEKV